jgi:hypothetical protein
MGMRGMRHFPEHRLINVFHAEANLGGKVRPRCARYAPLRLLSLWSRHSPQTRDAEQHTYFFFATTRVRNEPINGELISATSPGFKKRSGAELLSGNNSLESAAVPAAVPPLMMSPG